MPKQKDENTPEVSAAKPVVDRNSITVTFGDDTETYNKILDAAKADDRTPAKWLHRYLKGALTGAPLRS